jgi:hypothetical protein
MEPTQLSERLHRLADTTAPPPRDDLVDAVVTRHRERRQQGAAVVAVAALVATVAVLVPHLLTRSPASGPAPAATTPTSSGATVLAGSARGSLAGDTAFVDAVRGLSWTAPEDASAGGPADPPLDSRSVVFAGDVPGGRWALVAAPDSKTGRLAAMWFLGPAGASPADLRPVSRLAGIHEGTPVTLDDAATGTLVVVAAPGD